MSMQRRTFISTVSALFVTACSKSPPQSDMLRSTNTAKATKMRIDTTPFEQVVLDGSRVVQEWEALRQSGRGWPVLVGSEDDLRMLGEGLTDRTDNATVAAILKRADAVRYPSDVISKKKAEYAEYGEEMPEPEKGVWPLEAPASPNDAPIFVDHKNQPLASIHALIIPTEDFTTVPAHLHWGGWNENPMPEIHVAALRSWKDRYGAELVSLRSDVMEVRVARRPKTVDEAMALAEEHCYYCSDIVDQGVGTISALADVLMKSDWWFFWWD